MLQPHVGFWGTQEASLDYDLVLKGGHIIDPSQDLDGISDVAFCNGKVAAVGPDLARGAAPPLWHGL